MKNGFYIDKGNQIEFMGAGQISIGSGLKTDSRFSYDYSGKPQSLIRRGRKTARTATVTLQIARSVISHDINIFDIVALYESIAGKVGDLYWNGSYEGMFCVRGVSFSFAIDAIDIVSAVQISIELVEGYRVTEPKKRSIGTYHYF